MVYVHIYGNWHFMSITSVVKQPFSILIACMHPCWVRKFWALKLYKSFKAEKKGCNEVKHGGLGVGYLGDCWVLKSILIIEIDHTRHLMQLGRLSLPKLTTNVHFGELIFSSKIKSMPSSRNIKCTHTVSVQY